MGKVLKYIGWSFLGIIIFVAGTIGVLFAAGKFKDEDIYLNTINFDETALLDSIDTSNPNITTISVKDSNGNDKTVPMVMDDFSININFEPADATAKTLKLKLLKGSEAVSIPNTIVAGQPFTIDVKKVAQVDCGSVIYYIENGSLVDANHNPVGDNITYEIFEDVRVIRINEQLYKYRVYNVGGEVRIQATDNEGGSTYSQFEFFVESGIDEIKYDFSYVPGELENNTIVFNENEMVFTLYSTPSNALKPSTGEVFQSESFKFKEVETEVSSGEDVISIIKTDQKEKTLSSGVVNRTYEYTFKSLKAGTATITSRTLPTYQMYADYLVADEAFNTQIATGEGFRAVTEFANKYIDYLIYSGEIIVLGDGTVTTTGNEWYKSVISRENNLGNFVISTTNDYTTLMDFLWITVSQEITVENVELTKMNVSENNKSINLFETVKLDRDQLKTYFGIKLVSTSDSAPDSILDARLDDLKVYSIKRYKIYDSLDSITEEDKLEIFTVTKLVNGNYVEEIYNTPFETDGVMKYLTYTRNDAVLGVINPTEESKTWSFRANKPQTDKEDGTSLFLMLYDEVSGRYFDAVVKTDINVNDIQSFKLNSSLIKDMSLSTINNHGKPNVIYVDLRYETIGSPQSLIKDFTLEASYRNIKLFVTQASAKMDGKLKIRVKTKNGEIDGDPVVYTMNVGDTPTEVYEVDYQKDNSGLICIEALQTSVQYEEEGDVPTNSFKLDTVVMYVGVVRTDVNGEPIDADGNLVNDKVYNNETSKWEYTDRKYEFIKVAEEALQFNIYSYLQDVKFYTVDSADGAGNYLNRTVENGVTKSPIKMIVGQSFNIYVTNQTLDSAGQFAGDKTQELNLKTAFYHFYFNELTGQDTIAQFATSSNVNKPAITVDTSFSISKGILKISVQCKEETSSVDLFIAMEEEGNNFLEAYTTNIQTSYARIAKVEGTNQNDAYAFYTAGSDNNQLIYNNDTLIIKGFLENNRLVWNYFDEQNSEAKGEFVFGATGDEFNSLDYAIALDIDSAYQYMIPSIWADIKKEANYIWTVTEHNRKPGDSEASVNIAQKGTDVPGYDVALNIYKGLEEGLQVTVSCQIYMYADESGAVIDKTGTSFTFGFNLKIIQDDIDFENYSVMLDETSGEYVWIKNEDVLTSQKILGGTSFDVLASKSYSNEPGGAPVARSPIYASIDGADIRNSVTFSIEVYGATGTDMHNPIYFLNGSNTVTYSIGQLTASGGNYSLMVYAKDTYKTINAAIRIFTYHSGYATSTYYITVEPNLVELKELPDGKTYVESVRGVGDTYYTFGETGKSLDDYFKILDDGTPIKLDYTIESNQAYGTLREMSNKTYFIPNRVAPLSLSHYQEVNVLVTYTITFNGVQETYEYDTITIHVKPYYRPITLINNEIEVDAGVRTSLFPLGVTDPTIVEVDDFITLVNLYGEGIDGFNEIFAIKIEDSDDKVKTIFGSSSYNNNYITDGIITTLASLTSDELLKVKLYFKEPTVGASGFKPVELLGGESNPLYISVLKSLLYETDYTDENPLELSKELDYSYNIVYGLPVFNVEYKNVNQVVYNASDITNNIVSLTGGMNTDVFNQVITNVRLQVYNNGRWVSYSGTNVLLNVTKTDEFVTSVSIVYNDSVNVYTDYKLVFVSTNQETYEFYFALKPNVTIKTFYPIYDNYENVEHGTVVNFETNYIKQNNRVELAYNDVSLDARVVGTAENYITVGVPKQKLIDSGMLEDVMDVAVLPLLSDIVTINLMGSSRMFSYYVASGSENVDAGTMSGSIITFSIPEGGSGGDTIVTIRAFNGAEIQYNFSVKKTISKYNVSVTSGDASVVRANNEFKLSDFINSCRIPGSAPDMNALRIIVTEFNGTELRLVDGGSFSVVNIYDLISYDATLKFKDVATDKQVVFMMYTTSSVDGDEIVELRLTIKPNVIIEGNKTSIPAGENVTILNDDTYSPYIMINGDGNDTKITTGITYVLVDENNNEVTNDKVTISSGVITHANINEKVQIYVRIEVELEDCIYSEVVRIDFVPNVIVSRDYERSATPTNFKNMVAAPITEVSGGLDNTASINLWDSVNNSITYPITITNFYGESLAENGVADKPTIRFVEAEDYDFISIDPITGRLNYEAVNKSNVQVRINVVITWGDVEYIAPYNIHFQPNVSADGVSVSYVNKNGNNTNNQSYISLYGGSKVDILTLNTNNDTTINSDVPTNAILMQSYVRSTDQTKVVNYITIDVKDINNNPTISYLRLNSDSAAGYTITESGGVISISFDAVKEETEIRIPYFLDLVTINGGGLFSSTDNANYYKPTNNEIIIRVLPVISKVDTTYNQDNEYSVIIRENSQNMVNLYVLLNVTLIGNASFDNANASSKVIINKDALAKLFTLTVSNSYATLVGQTIIFNLHSENVAKFPITFNIEGMADTVTAYVSFGSKATLSAIDSVKTFTYDSTTYYIIDTKIYDYKLNEISGSSYDGGVVTLQGTEVVVSVSNLAIENGAEVLYIYSSETESIDLSTLVRYEVQNKVVTIDSVEYFVDVNNGSYSMVKADGVAYDGEYEMSDDSNYIIITETQNITEVGSDKVITFNETPYYVLPNADSTAYLLYVDAAGTQQAEITHDDYLVSYEVDYDSSIVTFSKYYPITIESVNLDESGLTYMVGATGDNDKFIQNGGTLTLIPFYSTDLANDKKAFTFEVTSNTSLSTSITFYLLPVETEWAISFDGTEYNIGDEFVVAEPATGTVVEVAIEGHYGTLGGTYVAYDYVYTVEGPSNVVSIEENTNILYINFKNFSRDLEIKINVRATFNGAPIANSWDIIVKPIRMFETYEITYDSDPLSGVAQYVTIDGDLLDYTVLGDSEINIELANESDSEYVTVDLENNKVNIAQNLYLLEQKDITFNVTNIAYINGERCVFNSNAVLKLLKNTKILGLNTRYLAGSGDIVDNAGIKTVTANSSSPISIVNEDETVNYTVLDIAVVEFKAVVTGSAHTTLDFSANINKNTGLITIAYANDASGNYPTKIDASLRIAVSYNGEPIYTSEEITIIITC